MNTLLPGLSTIVLYLAATVSYSLTTTKQGDSAALWRNAFLLLSTMGLLIHGYSLYTGIVSIGGFNLGIFKAASLVAWFIVIILLLNSINQQINNLVLILLPLSGLFVAIETVFVSERMIAEDAALGLRLHIILSIIAYSLLSIAALQAIFLWIQDYLLRQKTALGLLRYLPPLAIMENLMFQLITFGFVLLTAGLMAGITFLHDIQAQHLIHKTALSAIAWSVFAILLWGRWYRGWRGRLAVRYILTGIVFLMLAYFGSNLVLELILQRV